MKKKVIAAVLLFAAMAGAQMYESVIHTSKLGPMAVAITCRNGADPTGNNMKGVLIVSCGQEHKTPQK